ncbi:MAG TPA: cupin domain-containing protein, partial [Dehalococcoidia bacterium]
MSDVRIIRREDLDAGTAQTPGMVRMAAVSATTCDATGIWMGEVIMAPGFKSGAHHHGDVESAIYIASGALRFRWGARLERTGDGKQGDFIFVPAGMIHQEINASSSEPLVTIVARGGLENIVANVDLPEAQS